MANRAAAAKGQPRGGSKQVKRDNLPGLPGRNYPVKARSRYRIIGWTSKIESFILLMTMHRKLNISLVCLALLLPTYSQYASADLARLSVISNAFSEVWRSEVPVAGGVRAGILAGRMDKTVEMDALNVLLPTSDHNKLCVEVISRDGRYNAHMEYALSNHAAGNYLLDFPTRRSDILNDYRAKELAVLAYMVTDRCKTRDKRFLVAQWGSDADFEQITILLNSGGLDTSIVLPSSSGDTVFSKCIPATGDMKRTAFDTQCAVKLKPEMLSTKIKIRRKNYGNRLRDIKLPLLLQ